MGIDVAGSLRRFEGQGGLAVPLAPPAVSREGFPWNSLMGIGLWALLWAGYNSNPDALRDPGFPRNNLELIHGVRGFIPIMGGWIAIVVILIRGGRLLSWITGPLGLVLFYGVTGLVASLGVSIEPFDSIYWGGLYVSIALVLTAIVLVKDPLADLWRVLNFTWIVGMVLTFALLLEIPLVGDETLNDSYVVSHRILGMATARNTGFARYAAVSALVALARIWEGKRRARLVWAGILALSIYALAVTNGRTEILAFIVGAFVVVAARKKRRTAFILVGTAAALMLGFTEFYRNFFQYITRTGKIDLSLTGRTVAWAAGWDVFWKSPWCGLGFQADRYYLGGLHIHNAFLHVFLQGGLLGGGAIIIALLSVWFLTLKHFFLHPPRDKHLIPPEIPGVLLFVTFSSVTESTFAYYSAAWLLSAPIFVYVVALDRHVRRSRAKAAWEEALRRRVARYSFRGGSPGGEFVPRIPV